MVFITTARRGKRVNRRRNTRKAKKNIKRTRNARIVKNVRRMRKTLRRRNRKIQKGGADENDLYDAVMSKDVDRVNLALKDVDVNTLIGGSYTALHLASQKGFVDVVDTLIAAGANLDKKNFVDETAIYIASEKGHVEVVNILINAGADMNIPNDEGDSPLDIAVMNGFVDVVNTLIDAGAKMDTKKLLTLSYRKDRGDGDRERHRNYHIIHKKIKEKIKEKADLEARSPMTHLLSHVGSQYV